MILILSLVLAAFPAADTGEWYTFLQQSYSTGCSADYLIAGEYTKGVLVSDLPLSAIGSLPAIPWTEAETVDPLSSGLWGGGLWNLSVDDRSFQDSLSVSRIGLIQNTADHSRYIFELDRPLPWGSTGNFEIARDDSINLYSAVVKRKSLKTRIMSWEGRNYGWGGWTGWSSDIWYARTGFSRLSPDDRRPELLAGARAGISSIEFEFGAAAARVDSVVRSRGVAGARFGMGSADVSAYYERNHDGDSFWGGIVLPAGSFQLSAAVSQPAGNDFFQTVAVRHNNFNLLGRFSDEQALAADFQTAKGFFRGNAAACWNFTTDSLSAVGWALLGADWYEGRLEAGPRITLGLNSAGEFDETLDIMAGFSLATFSIAAAVEDITHQFERSWSFGITWNFTDQPPELPQERTEER